MRGRCFVASSLVLWRPSGAGSLDQTSAKSGSVASTQLLLVDAHHLALSLLVEATQPDGTEGLIAPDFITKYGSTLYIGMDEVLAHYACTFEISDLHFYFQ